MDPRAQEIFSTVSNYAQNQYVYISIFVIYIVLTIFILYFIYNNFNYSYVYIGLLVINLAIFVLFYIFNSQIDSFFTDVKNKLNAVPGDVNIVVRQTESTLTSVKTTIYIMIGITFCILLYCIAMVVFINRQGKTVNKSSIAKPANGNRPIMNWNKPLNRNL